MSDAFWIESGRMAVAFAIVAAAAVPVGVLAYVLVRQRPTHVTPPMPLRVPWGGFELVFAFVLVVSVPDLLRRAGVLPLAVGVAALPIQLALLLFGWKVLYPRWRPAFRSSEVPRSVAVAIIVWPVLTVLVLTINAMTTQVFSLFEWQTETHPLTKLTRDSTIEQILLLTQACAAAPIIEELLFRGLLLPWVIGARDRTAGVLSAPPLVVPIARPFVVVTIAGLYAAGTGGTGPIVLSIVFLLGLVALWFAVRRGKRHILGVYATAAFFALIHAGVWPTPIPLFFLGLALGWLAVRTRGLVAPILVHGLFNAVSAVYVLRGGAG